MNALIKTLIALAVITAPTSLYAAKKEYCDVSDSPCYSDKVEVTHGSSTKAGTQKIRLYCMDGDSYAKLKTAKLYDKENHAVSCDSFAIGDEMEEFKCSNISSQHDRWVQFKTTCEE